MPPSYQTSPELAAMDLEPTATTRTSQLCALVASRPSAKAWFEGSLREVEPMFDEHRFHAIFSAAGRLLGRAPLGVTLVEAGRLRAAGIDWPIDPWRIDELGRVVLLASAFEHLPADRAMTLLESCYSGADNRERQAILRALPFLPSPERFVPLAACATRSKVLPVFEALACENPFPAEHLPDLHFNQLVMKALFNGVALSRIRGLGGRIGPELSRMASDYATERRAAARPVPADIDMVLLPTPTH